MKALKRRPGRSYHIRAVLGASVVMAVISYALWPTDTEPRFWEVVYSRVAPGVPVPAFMPGLPSWWKDNSPEYKAFVGEVRDFEKWLVKAQQASGEVVGEAVEWLAAEAAVCKASWLEVLASYLLNRGDSEQQAAARGAYRSLLVSWQLLHWSQPVAADYALDTAAEALGFNWRSFMSLSVTGGRSNLPPCADAWSILRFMLDAPAGKGAPVPRPIGVEMEVLYSPAWRQYVARVYNYSWEAEAGRLGGHMQIPAGQSHPTLLWAWPAGAARKGLILSHAFLLGAEGQQMAWRLVVSWDKCLEVGLAPDQPLQSRGAVQMDAGATVEHYREGVLTASTELGFERGAVLEFAQGSWAPRLLPREECITREALAAAADTSELVLAFAFTAYNGIETTSSNTRLRLAPNQYYKQSATALLRRWGLPPATPGFMESLAFRQALQKRAEGGSPDPNPLADTLPTAEVRDEVWDSDGPADRQRLQRRQAWAGQRSLKVDLQGWADLEQSWQQGQRETQQAAQQGEGQAGGTQGPDMGASWLMELALGGSVDAWMAAARLSAGWANTEQERLRRLEPPKAARGPAVGWRAGVQQLAGGLPPLFVLGCAGGCLLLVCYWVYVQAAYHLESREGLPAWARSFVLLRSFQLNAAAAGPHGGKAKPGVPTAAKAVKGHRSEPPPAANYTPSSETAGTTGRGPKSDKQQRQRRRRRQQAALSKQSASRAAACPARDNSTSGRVTGQPAAAAESAASVLLLVQIPDAPAAAAPGAQVPAAAVNIVEPAEGSKCSSGAEAGADRPAPQGQLSPGGDTPSVLPPQGFAAPWVLPGVRPLWSAGSVTGQPQQGQQAGDSGGYSALEGSAMPLPGLQQPPPLEAAVGAVAAVAARLEAAVGAAAAVAARLEAAGRGGLQVAAAQVASSAALPAHSGPGLSATVTAAAPAVATAPAAPAVATAPAAPAVATAPAAPAVATAPAAPAELASPSHVDKQGAGEEEEEECVLCLDSPRACTLAPCGHRCACLDCTQALLQLSRERRLCPICRTEVLTFIVREFNS